MTSVFAEIYGGDRQVSMLPWQRVSLPLVAFVSVRKKEKREDRKLLPAAALQPWFAFLPCDVTCLG